MAKWVINTQNCRIWIIFTSAAGPPQKCISVFWTQFVLKINMILCHFSYGSCIIHWVEIHWEKNVVILIMVLSKCVHYSSWHIHMFQTWEYINAWYNRTYVFLFMSLYNKKFRYIDLCNNTALKISVINQIFNYIL